MSQENAVLPRRGQRPPRADSGGRRHHVGSGLGSRKRRRLCRIEGLHPGRVVAVERRRRTGRAEAEVIFLRIRKPSTDLVEGSKRHTCVACDHRHPEARGIS